MPRSDNIIIISEGDPPRFAIHLRTGVEARADGKFLPEIWRDTYADGVLIVRECLDDQSDTYDTHDAALTRARELLATVRASLAQGDS